MDELQGAFDAITNAFSSRNSAFESRLKEIGSELARVKDQKDGLNEEVRRLRDERDKMTKKNVELARRLASLKNKKETREQELEFVIQFLTKRLKGICEVISMEPAILADCKKEVKEAEKSISIATSPTKEAPPLKLTRSSRSHIRYAATSGKENVIPPSPVPDTESQFPVDLTLPLPDSPVIIPGRRSNSATARLPDKKQPSQTKRRRSSSMYIAPTPRKKKQEEIEGYCHGNPALTNQNLDESLLLFSEEEDVTAPLPAPAEIDVIKRLKEKTIGNELGYKFQAVVRKKNIRERLEGRTCANCEKWINQWDDAKRGTYLKSTCRHKYLHSPAKTPPHFYSLRIPDTQECQEEGYLHVIDDDDDDDVTDDVKRLKRVQSLPRSGGEDMGKVAKSSSTRATRIF